MNKVTSSQSGVHGTWTRVSTPTLTLYILQLSLLGLQVVPQGRAQAVGMGPRAMSPAGIFGSESNTCPSSWSGPHATV